MIDARRMEVYTAVYDNKLTAIMEPAAIVLSVSSFKDHLQKGTVLFSGSGSAKWQNIVNKNPAHFDFHIPYLEAFNKIAYEKYVLKDFTELMYSEPFYLKNFYTG
jgi:tRNA threonylcarbamoyladenosine biosynthesis protein TsaB